MFTPDQYQLIDFGDGRRLERFAGVTLDRPCPVAEGIERGDPDLWTRADGRFEKTGNDPGHWIADGELPERWNVAHGDVTLELKCTPVGHLGVFPEQTANWDWIARQVQAAGGPVSVLNLFAYTGGSTLAAVAAGAEVVHVDAARNTVAWARRNAELSGMAELPVRWIADDALKFAKRELKRGNRYDAVILDPPSYGHGTRGEVWRLTKHLPRLLQLCGELTAGRRRFVLLTCHTPGFDPGRLKTMTAEALGESAPLTASHLTLRSVTGRELPSGVVVRF
ncbi:MAG: class I SAM-dependent methyltransferase [Candidatus Nealsonbacteria bacterium]|nr:class I SAM-dependent methyltransferase [Candidatus Nealsonbacteria bacterium]